MSDPGSGGVWGPRAVRQHYTQVCHCEWGGDDEWPTRVTSSADCVIHGEVPDPLDVYVAEFDALIAECDHYRNALKRIAEGPPDVTLIGTQIFARRALDGGRSGEAE